ncbi:MAG: hypothetical protein JWN45_2595 [Acidobacteriaceae bacterium]|nr:hypothetical protein [Acidobacteriaceae bacterium]
MEGPVIQERREMSCVAILKSEHLRNEFADQNARLKNRIV